MMKRLILLFALVLSVNVFAVDENAGYALFDTTANEIVFPKGDANFQDFYKKLDNLVFEGQGKVRILHIGGSHIQADVISGRIREKLAMKYPAAAADRGFVFPYSAAKTNTPSSYSSVYKGKWTMSKNVLREIKKPLGLLGIAVSTEDPRAEFTIAINRYSPEPIWFYNRARLFGFAEGDVEPVLRIDSTLIHGTLDSASSSYVFEIPRLSDSLQVTFLWSDTTLQDSLAKAIADSILQDSIRALDPVADSLYKLAQDSIAKADSLAKIAKAPLDSIYQDSSIIQDSGVVDIRKYPRFTVSGVLLENDNAGITYQSVGINGAKVTNYFAEPCPNFERELEFLKPDLVILAIGINDANVEHFDEKHFRATYDTLIARIRNVSPNVPVIFTTNNDMYRKVKRRYVKHPNGKVASDAFKKLADDYGGGVWDMFTLMGGLGSMADWAKAGLAKGDKVHFTHAGYVFLGDMFFKAFQKAYYKHIAELPAEEPPQEAPPKTDPQNTAANTAAGGELPKNMDDIAK